MKLVYLGFLILMVEACHPIPPEAFQRAGEQFANGLPHQQQKPANQPTNCILINNHLECDNGVTCTRIGSLIQCTD